MSEVEFLVGEPDGGAAAEPPRRRRARVLQVVALLVVLAAVGAWVGTRPSGRAARTGAVAPPVATVTAPAAAPATATSRAAVFCRSGAPVMDEIASAMHRFLPGVKIDNLAANRCIRDVHGEQRVVAESVTGTLGGLVVQIQVSVRNVDFAPVLVPPVPGLNPATVLGSVEVESAGLKAYATVTGSAGHRAPVLKLRRLVDYLCLNTVL
ncbi:MAG TPA: hypothetical protein VH395_01240 [Jatrophihabitantaceae bacterium]